MSYRYDISDDGGVLISANTFEDKRITSEQDPYKLVDVAHFIVDENMPEQEGKLFISISPGKKDNKWNRDLEHDLNNIVNGEINIIVCLLEWAEMRMLNITDYPIRAQEMGITFYHLPIKDRGVPQLKELTTLIPIIIQHLAAGKNVLIHCRAGLGRAGLMCACCLTHFGYGGNDAIEVVRNQRPKAIQTTKQEECVISYSELLLT